MCSSILTGRPETLLCDPQRGAEVKPMRATGSRAWCGPSGGRVRGTAGRSEWRRTAAGLTQVQWWLTARWLRLPCSDQQSRALDGRNVQGMTKKLRRGWRLETHSSPQQRLLSCFIALTKQPCIPWDEASASREWVLLKSPTTGPNGPCRWWCHV